MKRFLTLFSALILLHSGDISAQLRQAVASIPSSVIPSGIKPAQFQAKLRQISRAVYGTPDGLQKTTAGTERLVGLSDYDLTLAPGSQMEDSMRFVYSGGRTSAFDFDNLTYDYFNNADFPSPFPTGAFIDFDTLLTYIPPGFSTSSVFGVRNYNAAGKVTRDENPNVISTFNYDASNRLVRSSVIEYNALTANWDSSYRDFYRYDAGGRLVLDSSESWDMATSSYEPSGNLVYTNNAAGYPVRVTIDFVLGPVTVTVIQIDITYGVPANRPSLAILKFFDGISLQNAAKDTLGYSGTMMNYYNGYDWDTTALAWTLVYQERRQLNASSLPDSVWARSYNNNLPVDSARYKLAYNAQNNPTYLRTYVGNNATPDLESRWYYGPITGVGITPSAAKADLVIYPNPATDKLYLNGVKEGRYAVYNAAGQLAQEGTLQSAGISVHALAPGVYSLSLQDKAGVVHTAQFIRK